MVTKMFEMARIGWIPIGSTKSVEVYVMTNDPGNIPHFHVRKYRKNHDFGWDVPIRYDSAKYFLHGKYKKKLPDNDIAKELDKMLRSDNPKDPGRTYWQSAIIAWNLNNSKIDVPFKLEQPDYTQLS